jgi:SAM-dependent methyltransferase
MASGPSPTSAGYEDHFSAQAAPYARYRPHYPAGLFAYLAALAPGGGLAWDCGTGSGQAARGLAPHFRRVVATDPSARQLAHAVLHERITYRVAAAEASGLEAASADLITVAQALHWFDLDVFYAEACRVLRPGGVLAVWCYHLCRIAPEIDRLLFRYYDDVVGPYWSPRVAPVKDHYRSLAFPFDEVAPPAFAGETWWALEDALGYLQSWSSTQRFIRLRGFDPRAEIRDALTAAWGDPEQKRRAVWPLYLRVGRRPPGSRS